MTGDSKKQGGAWLWVPNALLETEAPVSHVLPVLRMVFGVLLKAQNEIAEPFARFSHQNSSSPSSQSPLISRNSPLLRVTCAAERR